MAVALILLVPLGILLLLLLTAGPQKTATFVGNPIISASTLRIDDVLGNTRTVGLYRLDPPYEGHADVLVTALSTKRGRQFVNVCSVGAESGERRELWATRGTVDPGAALSAKGYLIEGTLAHEAASSSRVRGTVLIGTGALVFASAIVIAVSVAAR